MGPIQRCSAGQAAAAAAAAAAAMVVVIFVAVSTHPDTLWTPTEQTSPSHTTTHHTPHTTTRANSHRTAAEVRALPRGPPASRRYLGGISTVSPTRRCPPGTRSGAPEIQPRYSRDASGIQPRHRRDTAKMPARCRRVPRSAEIPPRYRRDTAEIRLEMHPRRWVPRSASVPLR